MYCVFCTKESARVVSKQEGQNFALSKGALFKEVSAKRNEGVQEVFDQLVNEVRHRSLPSLLLPGRFSTAHNNDH